MPNRSRTTTGVASAAAAVMVLGTTAPAQAAVPLDQPSPRAAMAGLTCMPKPSACGFPDATNTGVPPGTPLTRVDGSVTLSTPGQVYSGREVHGSIRITASNVTIEKTRVIGSSEVPLIYPTSGATNTVIRDVEVDMAGQEEGKGIAFDNYTAQRVWFHNGLDCAHQGNNVTITDSFCDLPKLGSGSAAHADGFQSDGGGNYVFRHNTIRNPNSQTSAILMSTNTSPISNVVIDHNLMSGGGYTVYCGTDEGGIAPNTTYTNNVISREFFPKGGYWGPTTWCDKVATASNNVWDGNYVPPAGTGTPPPGSGNPGGAGTAPRRLGLRRAKKFARNALSQALGRKVVPRAKGLRVRCDRRSATKVACGVKWRKARGGKTVRRYAGKVVLTRSSAPRYRMHIRVWERKCGCSHTVKRSGSL
jgi:hypothetical protein